MKMYIKKQAEKILDRFLVFKSFRDYICYKANFSNVCKKTFKYVGTDDALFINDNMINTIEEVNRDYIVDDIFPTDTVLDIGACIGGFSLKVCKKAKHIYAVEPFVSERLGENIALNKAKNITVFDCALGDGEQTITWDNKIKTLRCLSLSEIIKKCNTKIDFLKVDCEGGELFIKPEELKGIRRIEAEVHCDKYRMKEFEDMLDKAGYEYTTEGYNSIHLYIVHANLKQECDDK